MTDQPPPRPPDDQASDPGAEHAALAPDQLLEFARAFVQLSNQVHRLEPPNREIADRVRVHMGTDPAELLSVGEALPQVERPNLQLALDHLIAEQAEAEVIGLSPELSHYGDFSLSALLAGRFGGPSQPGPPAYTQVPSGVDRTLRCVIAGIWLLHHDGEPIVVGLVPSEGHGPPGSGMLKVEVFAARTEVAQAATDRLTELRRRFNVYRGQVLGFAHGEYGDFGLRFLERPTVGAADVILPDGHLDSIHRHAVGIGERADELVARGQHLRRGLLLYGPPGTGKTHTIGYLLSTMSDRTTVILQGPSVGALGQAAAIVRALTPAMLIIEDVDLIAHERFAHGMGPSNPLMFQLLNEMDGLTPTDDVLFVLTTNRVDVLEPALAARPGRIDHAIEVGLPDADGRERLLHLYLEPTGHRVTELAPVIERTEGVTASFVKELVRRAVHLAVETGADLDEGILDRALTELLDGSAPAVRAALGVVSDEDGPTSTGGVAWGPGDRFDDPGMTEVEIAPDHTFEEYE